MTGPITEDAVAALRVSDERLADYIAYCRFEDENHLQISGQTALDLRDARAQRDADKATIAEMRKALEPFARASKAIGDEPGPYRFETGTGYRELSREDLRESARVLAKVGGK